MTVVNSNAEKAHAYRVAERVELACELSCLDAPVRWFKDGEAVEERDGLLLEREGLLHRLIIPSAKVQDAGEFVCDVGGASACFNVTVTGQSFPHSKHHYLHVC